MVYLLRAAARRTGLTRRVRALLARVNLSRTLVVGGASVRVPTVLGLRCALTEPWMIDVLRRFLPLRDGAFVDVGVNLGQTLIKVKAIEPQRRYVGFEPNPTCAFYVQELIKENGFTDTAIVPIGLFSEDRLSVLSLYSDDPADVKASIIDDRPNPVHKRLVVPMFRWTSVAEALDLHDIGIVKIDVEGAELDVIGSLRGLLDAQRPVVLLEVLPVYRPENTERLRRQREVERIFAGLEYAMFRVSKTGDDTYAGLDPIEEIGIHSDMNRCDYVFVPREVDLPTV